MAEFSGGPGSYGKQCSLINWRRNVMRGGEVRGFAYG